MVDIARVTTRVAVATFVTGYCLFSSGCKSDASAATAAQAIKQCAASDAAPASAIRYTGPTGAGPGSYWVQTTGAGSVFVIGALPEDIFGKPVPENIFAPAPNAGVCAYSSNKSIDLKANIGADLRALPLSAKAQAELKDAQIVSVAADAFQWNSIKYLVYNEEIIKSERAKAYRGPNIWVAVGMLRVKNYVATLDVSNVRNIDLSGKYNGPLGEAVTGNLSAGVTSSYDGASKLKLTVPGETYVAGLFRPANAVSGEVESAHSDGSTPPMDWTLVPIEIQGPRK